MVKLKIKELIFLLQVHGTAMAIFFVIKRLCRYMLYTSLFVVTYILRFLVIIITVQLRNHEHFVVNGTDKFCLDQLNHDKFQDMHGNNKTTNKQIYLACMFCLPIVGVKGISSFTFCKLCIDDNSLEYYDMTWNGFKLEIQAEEVYYCFCLLFFFSQLIDSFPKIFLVYTVL